MPEYNIDFAFQMAHASKNILENDSESEGAKRAALYTSLVACEIGLKVALENAGHKIKDIMKKRHNLSELLKMVSSCTVIRNMTEEGNPRRVLATCIRGKTVTEGTTVGELLEAEEAGASVFPNEIRYGDVVKHYDVSVMSRLSFVVLSWVTLHSSDIED